MKKSLPNPRYFLAAAICFVLASLIAYFQDFRPNAYQTPPVGSLNWWLYPVEQNAEQRLPFYNEDRDMIIDIANISGTETYMAVNSDRRVMISRDDGKTWDPLTLNIEGPNKEFLDWSGIKFYCIHFQTPLRGWLVGDSQLLTTKDGGASWQRESFEYHGEWSSRIYFCSQDEGWLLGDPTYKTNDGGKTWTLYMINGEVTYWSSVFFRGKDGWASGKSGILRSSDFGKSWNRIDDSLGDLTQDIQGLYFSDQLKGFAVLRDRVMHTIDGGRSWDVFIQEEGETFVSIYFSDDQVGWITGSITLITEDGGESWERMSSAPQVSYRLFKDDQYRLWLAGTSLRRSSDNGKSWETLSRGIEDGIYKSTWVSPQMGWVINLQGQILFTADGGVHWDIQHESSSIINSALAFNAKEIWAVSSSHLITSLDGGITWMNRHPLSSAFRSKIHTLVRDGKTIVAYGGYGGLASHDNGGTWEEFLRPADAKLIDGVFPTSPPSLLIGKSDSEIANILTCQILDATRGFVVNGANELLFTKDSGQTFESRGMPTDIERVSQIYFLPDGMHGWLLDVNGLICSTQDGGKSWGEPYDMSAPLLGIAFVNEMSGFAWGDYRILYGTKDGGESWSNLRPHRSWPAPWYYPALALVLVLCFMGFRNKPAADESVADILVTDSPLSGKEGESSALAAIAHGISRFLRNRQTQAPLTIAVTGEWGSGKSSLMNILKDDLMRYGSRPVWFNAWHHQKEEHLLASLLENIRTQAIPPLTTRRGIIFRLRLLFSRGLKNWFPVLALIGSLAVSTTYLYRNPQLYKPILDHPVETIKGYWVKNSDQKTPSTKTEIKTENKQATIPTSTPPEVNLKNLGLPLLWLINFMALMTAFLKGLQIFGVKPATLGTTLSKGFKIKSFEDKLGFRYRFAAQFHEIAKALQPRTMVIIIDDLDRCAPGGVLDLLEATNFLVSSGECVILMGMDLPRVEHCVGLGFKDFVDQPDGTDAPGLPDSADAVKHQRTQFARNYLQKLINIEVPVPTLSWSEFQGGAHEIKPTLFERLWFGARLHLGRILPLLIILATLGLGMWAGMSLPKLPEKTQPSDNTSHANDIKTGGVAPEKESPIEIDLEPNAPPVQRPQTDEPRNRIIQGKATRPQFTSWWGVLVGLLLMTLWYFFRKDPYEIQDSNQFKEALAIWRPIAFEKRSNPRANKRFINRVRYYAMAQGGPSFTISIVQRGLIKLGMLSERSVHAQKEIIPEDILVALSAIQHFQEDWLKEDLLWTNFGAFLDQIPDLAEILKPHMATFHQWPSLEKYRHTFQWLSSGIKVL